MNEPTAPTFMDRALEEAEAAGARGEIPVGAVLVRDGEVDRRGRQPHARAADVTAHAEVLAIRAAARRSSAASG